MATLAGIAGILVVLGIVGTVGSWLEDSPQKWPITFGTLALLVFALTWGEPTKKSYAPRDCYIEWDGRSNPTVCD